MDVGSIMDMGGGGGSSWGMGLSIGGMAEQDISSFIGTNLTVDDLLLAADKTKEQLTKYYGEARPYVEQLAGEFDRGREGLTRGLAEGAFEMPLESYEFRYPESQVPVYERPPFEFRFEEEPGYQFRLEQGQRAIEGSAAARGQALSGATMQALQQYGQGLASDEYQRAYERAMGEYKYGSEFDRLQNLEAQRRYEASRALGAETQYRTRGQQAAELANRYGRQYQSYLPLYQTGAQGTKTLADLIYGYGTQRAQLERDIGNIKAGGWEASMQNFAQQGQHLQEIGGMGGGTVGQYPSQYQQSTQQVQQPTQQPISGQ